MLPINSIISNTLSWTPLLIRPRKSLENIVECFRFYDASVWNANLELFESGLKLGMDILLPALLLSLVGSILPTSVCVGGPIPVCGFPPFLDAFSPYTSHSSALSSSYSSILQKIITIVCSIIIFNHTLVSLQWIAFGIVFIGTTI